MDSKISSVLIGNGLDIQVGGDDYLNKWIIVRLLSKAKMGKYDALFTGSQNDEPIVTGDEIVIFFNDIIEIANKARQNEYYDLTERYGDMDLIDAYKDFKIRYKSSITSIEEIGMEDWFLILLLFLIEQDDILEHYETVKQGFERMIIDAIYCESNIQKLYLKMGKSAKLYFSNFENVFTLNYDNTIEKLISRPIFHLHGDFNTKHMSENPKNALGYLRKQKGQTVLFPPQFEHCNCNAILDFSGNRKYRRATNMTNAYLEFEKVKEAAKSDENNLKFIIDKLPVEQHELVQIGVSENLHLGHDYHFSEFKQIRGTLIIIGLAPQNDSHIFSCINESNVENVVFYHFFGNKSDYEVEKEIKTIKLPLSKPYIIKNVNEVWHNIGVQKPKNSNYSLSETQLELLNVFCPRNPLSMDNILWQLGSIPIVTKKMIFEMMSFEISKDKYHSTTKTETEFMKNFIDFGKTLKVASVSPQALYYIYITGLQPKNKITHNKKRKRKK